MGMVLVGLVLGWYAARPGDLLGHRTIPVSTEDRVFEPFAIPQLATPIPGLHDYAVVLGRTAPAPTASPKPVSSARPKATPAAGHSGAGSGHRTISKVHRNITGKASWYATGRDGYYAAACRPLRQAIGSDWRGRHVLVAFGRKAIEVTLNDFCASHDKTIDLSDEAFRALGPLSRGVLRVSVGW